jgi:coenzyme PQQ precursor peptide PqqA
MTTWEKPSFVEVDMSAEIGGYQGESDDRNRPDAPSFVAPVGNPPAGDA